MFLRAAPAPALGRGLMGTACSVAVGFASTEAGQAAAVNFVDPKKAGVSLAFLTAASETAS